MKKTAAWPWTIISIISVVVATFLLYTTGSGLGWTIFIVITSYALGRSDQKTAMTPRRTAPAKAE